MKKMPLLSIILLLNFSSFAKEPSVEIEKKLSNVNVTSEYFLTDQAFAGNKKIKNFSKAKSIFKKVSYFGIKEEIYCGCEFYKGIIPKEAKCGIKARKTPTERLK